MWLSANRQTKPAQKKIENLQCRRRDFTQRVISFSLIDQAEKRQTHVCASSLWRPQKCSNGTDASAYPATVTWHYCWPCQIIRSVIQFVLLTPFIYNPGSATSCFKFIRKILQALLWHICAAQMESRFGSMPALPHTSLSQNLAGFWMDNTWL